MAYHLVVEYTVRLSTRPSWRISAVYTTLRSKLENVRRLASKFVTHWLLSRNWNERPLEPWTEIDHFTESSTSGTLGFFIWKIQLDKYKNIFVKFYILVKIPSRIFNTIKIKLDEKRIFILVKFEFSYNSTKCPRSWQLSAVIY